MTTNKLGNGEQYRRESKAARDASTRASDRQSITALVEALESIMDYIPLSVVRCHGDKCRELWCASCFDEEEAEAYLVTAERHLKNAEAALISYHKGGEV